MDLIKGKVKKIETYYYYPKKHKPTRIVSEYDFCGRKISAISYYIKNNPQKETFYYDSIGNVSMSSYGNSNELHYWMYEYKYDNLGRIESQTELHDDKLFRLIDSVLYAKDNLPVQYIVKIGYDQYYSFINYPDSENPNEKRLIVEKKRSDGTVDQEESIYYCNSNGFLMRKVKNSITHLNWNGIENYPSKHSEEYEYVDYKYDKQGNWIELKCYLDWENKGKEQHYRVKRKIEYY
jgi:hypothetical protein